MEPNISNGSVPGVKWSGGSFHSTQYIIAFSLIAILIFLENFLILYLFATKASLRTKANIILASLATSDMLNGAVAIPLQIGCNEYMHNLSLRLASMVLYRFIASSTMFHILAVTLERHICVVFPLRYNSLVTKRRTVGVTCVIWIASACYAVIGLSWLGLKDNFNHQEQPKLSNSKVLQIEFSYSIIAFLLCFLVPLVIMCYSFTKILREIARHNKRESEIVLDSELTHGRTKLQIDRKPVVIFMAMLLLFVVTWSTWYIQMFILCLSPHYIRKFNGIHIYLLRSSTSLFNPLLYSLIKKDFRQALLKFFARNKERIFTGLRLKRLSLKTGTESTMA